MKRTSILILFIGIFTQLGISQNLDKQKLDGYFNALDENNRFMGSVAVSQNGNIIYSKTIGFLDIENNVKANKNSKYRIGSISKIFTSVLILKAVEENKLALGQTIDKFFPDIKNAKKITVQHLLAHRSGIPNFTNEEDYLTWNTEPKSESEMVNIISKSGSDFEPDSKSGYSNSNFVLLSFILEKIFDTTYANLLKTYITEPLGLESTYLGGKINIDNNESKSYKFNGNWVVETETDISIPLGAGGIVSNPKDLVKFSDQLFAGNILKSSSLKDMKTVNGQYGMGLFKIPFYDKTGYGHTGGIDGFVSVLVHFSDGDISYALTSNGTNYNVNNISIAVLSAVYNMPYSIPEFSHYEISSEDLDKYLGIYSSKQNPLKITITKNNKTLIAQATGQSSFPLEATAKDQFKYDVADVTLEFNPKENTMVLIQYGRKTKFNKE